MLISPSRKVVVSLFRDSYSKSVRLGGFKSMENDYLNGDVTPLILWNFQNWNTSAGENIFLHTDFSFYIDKHMVHERENVNVGAEWKVYGNAR